jgi:hypothetical protein
MNKKKTIVESLKAWYIVDSILLNDHARTYFKENKDFKEYIITKAALISTLHEFYNHIGYKTKNVYKTDKMLQESAVMASKTSKAVTASMLQKPTFKTYLKNYIMKESVTRKVKDVKSFQKNVIFERFLRMSLDNALIGVPLLECKNNIKKQDFTRDILEESYRMLRTALIHLTRTSSKN